MGDTSSTTTKTTTNTNITAKIDAAKEEVCINKFSYVNNVFAGMHALLSEERLDKSLTLNSWIFLGGVLAFNHTNYLR